MNWCRKTNEYPTFKEDLKPRFDRDYSTFLNFVRNDIDTIEEPKVTSCNLTYVDVVESGEYWKTPSDTSKLLSSFQLPHWRSIEESECEFNCQYSYKPQENLRFDLTLLTSRVTQNPNKCNLILESKATGYFKKATVKELDVWLEDAHEFIVNWFVKNTDLDIQREYWKLGESN